MNHKNNIERIKTVYNSLGGELQHKVVFVGGATVSMYSDRQAFEVRETDDVDAIVELLNYADHTRFEEQLRGKGFSDDVESHVRCRYRIHGIKVDIMPTKNIAMGFENKWYPDGYHEAMDYMIDEHSTIKILSAPHFIATKLEAFKNRGYGDGRMSHDFEDIVYVFENRRSIWKEMQGTNENLKEYLQSEFKKLLSNDNIVEWIDCHVERASPPATYLILDGLEKFVE